MNTIRIIRWAAALWAAADADLAEVYAEEWPAIVACAPAWRRPFVAAGFVTGAIWQSRAVVLRRAADWLTGAGRRGQAELAAPAPAALPPEPDYVRFAVKSRRAELPALRSPEWEAEVFKYQMKLAVLYASARYGRLRVWNADSSPKFVMGSIQAG